MKRLSGLILTSTVMQLAAQSPAGVSQTHGKLGVFTQIVTEALLDGPDQVDQLVSEALRLLDGYELGKVDFQTKAAEGRLIRPMHQSFESQEKFLREALERPIRAVRVVRYGNNFTVSWRNGIALDRWIVRGADALTVPASELGVPGLELVDFVLAFVGVERDRPFLTLFFVAPTPTVDLARKMFEHFQAKVSCEFLAVNIQQEPWFVENERFPLVHLFWNPPRIRTPLEASRLAVAGCSKVFGDKVCFMK